MKMLKKCFALLIALMMLFSMAIIGFAKAEDGVYEVIYKGRDEGFVFVTNSSYTENDLFANFKNVMPGDVLRQKIDVVNACDESDFIELYLQALPHNEENKPVAEELANVSLEAMKEFLNQFTMTVVNLDRAEKVFEGPAGEMLQLEKSVFLGKLDYGDSVTLEVILFVPLDMERDYASKIGEIDWLFSADRFDNEVEEPDHDSGYNVTVKKVWKDGNSKSRPDSVKITLLRKGKIVDTVILSEKNNWRHTWRDLDYRSGWEVEEINVPKGYKVSYEAKERSFIVTNSAVLAPTGQLNWPIPVLMIVGIVLIATGASLLRKGRKNA